MYFSRAFRLLAVAGMGSLSGGSMNVLLRHEHGSWLSGLHSPTGRMTAVLARLSTSVAATIVSTNAGSCVWGLWWWRGAQPANHLSQPPCMSGPRKVAFSRIRFNLKVIIVDCWFFMQIFPNVRPIWQPTCGVWVDGRRFTSQGIIIRFTELSNSSEVHLKDCSPQWHRPITWLPPLLSSWSVHPWPWKRIHLGCQPWLISYCRRSSTPSPRPWSWSHPGRKHWAPVSAVEVFRMMSFCWLFSKLSYHSVWTELFNGGSSLE